MSEREIDKELERVVNSHSTDGQTADQWVENFHAERINRRTRTLSNVIYSFLGAAGFFWALGNRTIDWMGSVTCVCFLCLHLFRQCGQAA